MTDFDFSLADLENEDGSVFVKQINSQLPFQKKMMTSRAASAASSKNIAGYTSLSTLTASQILQGIPLYASPAQVQANQESLFSDLLGAITSNKSNGFGVGLGVFDQILPDDLKMQAALVASTTADTAADAAGGAGEGALSGSYPGATTDAQAILSNPLVTFGSARIRQDIVENLICPNILFMISVITQKFAIKITSLKTGHTQNVAGTNKRSNHSFGRGCDIGALADAADPNKWHRVIERPIHQFVVEAYQILASLTGNRTPEEVGGPINPAEWDRKYPHTQWFTNSDHQNHIHVGYTDPGQPLAPTTPAASTAPSSDIQRTGTQ